MAVLSLEGFADPCLKLPGVRKIVKGFAGEAPSSIAIAAMEYPGWLLAMVFPDTIWWPEDGMVRLLSAMDDEADGVLGLFRERGDMLDRVTVEDGWVTRIEQKAKGLTEIVDGWGCFIVRSNLAAAWTDDGYISDNLERMRLRAVSLDGPYNDCGTPAQYRRALNL